MSKNIILIGFMGVGKSVATKELADRLKYDSVSTDELIEKKEGRPIAEIFTNNGEAYFRELEREIVKSVVEKQNLIIDCGGGIFMDEENRVQLSKNGTVVYLAASAETLRKRTKDYDHRPLLNVEDPMSKIREMLAKREPYYKQADVTINTDGKTNEQVCNEIEDNLPND